MEHREAWFAQLAADPVRYPHQVVSQKAFTRYLRGGTPSTTGRFLTWLLRIDASPDRSALPSSEPLDLRIE